MQRRLDAAVDAYAAALELYDQWKAGRVSTRAALDAKLKGMSVLQQIAELRRQ